MSERIITLFGEEIVPGQVKAAGKSRAKKKPEEKIQEAPTPETEKPAPAAEQQGPGTPGDAQEKKEPEISGTEVIEQPTPIAVKNENSATEIAQLQVAAEQPPPPGPAVADTRNEENEPEVTEPTAATKETEQKALKAPKAKAGKELEKSETEKNIVLPEDWNGEKQYYSIGEVANLFNVKTSHIRFWTNEFKLKVRTTRKGDRLFTPDQIRELRAIHHLVKERGFTLSGAKAKMKAQNKMDVETIDLKQSLLQLRNKLVIIKNQLA